MLLKHVHCLVLLLLDRSHKRWGSTVRSDGRKLRVRENVEWSDGMGERLRMYEEVVKTT